jgi:uncharacterized protein (TIGR02265 family)
MATEPTIKGVFMKSHIRAVERSKGIGGLKKLEQSFGKPIVYKNSDDVPIRDESKLIECAVQIMSDHPIQEERVAYEAGRLHFRNFAGTPLGRITLPFFKNNYKTILLRARYLGGHVFQGIKFASEELGPKAVHVVMSNAEYPIDHFKGLFEAWMEYSGLEGSVASKPIDRKMYGYTIEWK